MVQTTLTYVVEPETDLAGLIQRKLPGVPTLVIGSHHHHGQKIPTDIQSDIELVWFYF